MKPYVIALALLLSVAAPVMAADLTATQISSTEMRVDGTGFNPGTVTLVTETSLSVTPSGDDYSYEIKGLTLPAGAVLKLDASPVNDDLELYMKQSWLVVLRFDKSDGSTIGYSYDSSKGTVHVERSVPFELTFKTIRISGTTTHPNVNLNVVVKQEVTADGGGSFSELVDVSAIPAGDYRMHAADGANTATTQKTIYAPGDLHSITITDPETGDLTLDANKIYTFGATGYDYSGVVVQDAAFTWNSSNTSVGTISSTGDFEADTAGTTEVYASSGAKDSNSVTVHVNAPTATPTASPTVTPTIIWAKATPTPTKPVVADETPIAPAEETSTPTKPVAAEVTVNLTVDGAVLNSTPGFAAVFAIAGLLAIAYAMLRRRGQ